MVPRHRFVWKKLSAEWPVTLSASEASVLGTAEILYSAALHSE